MLILYFSYLLMYSICFWFIAKLVHGFFLDNLHVQIYSSNLLRFAANNTRRCTHSYNRRFIEFEYFVIFFCPTFPRLRAPAAVLFIPPQCNYGFIVTLFYDRPCAQTPTVNKLSLSIRCCFVTTASGRVDDTV